MPKKRTRAVQTCTLCDKTGHNKRRCAFVPKTSLTSKRTHKKERIKKTSMMPRTIDMQTNEREDDTAVSVPSVKKRTRSHYVPVVLGKTKRVSDHVVDLSTQGSIDPPWDSIKLFREQLRDVVQYHELDFAASIRAAKQRTAKKKKRRTVSFPRISIPRIPRIPIPHIRIHVPHIRVPRIRLKRSLPSLPLRRAIPALLALLLLVSLPLPALSAYQNIRQESAHIVSASSYAFAALEQSTTAALQADTETAESALQDALSAFGELETLLDHDYKFLTDVCSALPVIGDHVSGRKAIVLAGQHIALANTYVIKGITEAQQAENIPMTERLSILTMHMEHALPQYEEARKELLSVNQRILPEDQQQLFNEFLVLYSAFIDDIRDVSELSHVLYDVFGGSDFRRYLILFQNNNELRPTGGFIGSYAILDTQKGRIENIDIPVGGSYDIQGQLHARLIPPTPLQLVNSTWELQDSNWFFDFPSSARKAESFVEHAKGTSFDGTIAINASVIERLLRIIGPVASDEYHVLLDAETVLPTLQHHVETGYTDTGDAGPKQILSSVLSSLLDAAQDIRPEQLILLLQELHEALGQKEIQIALKDQKNNARLASFGWTGNVVQTSPRQDYLAVVATNLQGQKSDARIEQHIDHRAEIGNDGSVIVRTSITRTHTGDPSEEHYGSRNIAYMRVYVPQGAVLLDAGGFTYPPEDAFHVPESWYSEDPDLARLEHEVGIHKDTGTRITNQFGKTVFGNWMIVEPGESQEIWFTYRLPFSVVDTKRSASSVPSLFASQPDAVSRYSLYIQKQSGITSDVSSTILYGPAWQPRWKSSDTMEFLAHGMHVDTTLDTDTVFGTVLEAHF